MTEPEQGLCSRQCKHHEETMKKVHNSVTKSSIKWLATIFAIPTLAIIFGLWAFISSADYRYASLIQQQINATNIRLHDERMNALKIDLVRLQTELQADLAVIKTDLKDIAKEIRMRK